MKNTGNGVLNYWNTGLNIENMLSSSQYRSADNREDRLMMKRAISAAIDKALSPAQKRRIIQYYFKGMTKTKIANIDRVTCSAVSKSLGSARECILEYAEIYSAGYVQARSDITKE